MRVAHRILPVLPLVLAIGACSAGPAPGWTYAPVPSSAAPSGSAAASGSAEPPASASPAPSAPASPAPSAPASPSAPGGTTLTLVALNIAFDQTELTVPADQPFSIAFDNQDALPHDVDIRDATGTTLQDQEIVTGPLQQTYEYTPLAAAEYVFICSVHPAQMTGKLIVP